MPPVPRLRVLRFSVLRVVARRCSVITALLSAGAGASAFAENWPQWRGPRHNGISSETGIATQWSSEEHVTWRLPLPGPAGASPVVWDDRIYLTSTEGEAEGVPLLLLCVGTDGTELWRRQLGGGNKKARTAEGNSASPSPCTDGEHVWCFFGNGPLACHDRDGNKVWEFNVQDRYGEFDIAFGMTSTPVLSGDSLYLQLIHGALRGESRVGKVVRLNKASGEEIWAVDRPTNATGECKHSYASAMLYSDGGREFLVTHGANNTVAHDLDDGRELGRLGGLNGPSRINSHAYDNTFRLVATPSFAADTLIIPTCKNGPLVALNVRDDLTGNLTDNADAVRWVYEKSPDVSVPLVVDGLVYIVMKPGQVACLDLQTGEEQYFQRIHSAEHRASPVSADGHIYICARDGVCTVLKAGRAFEVVAENSIGNEPITASPAISGGVLYLRSFDALYAIR